MNGAGPAYIYGPRGERIWTGTYGGPPSVLSYTSFGNETTYPEQYDLYGIDGVKLGSYKLSAYGTNEGVNPPPPFLFFAKQESRVYFAGRLMQMNAASVHPDRLGSLGTFYPYGEARTPATNPAVFATYRRDADGGAWDYAMNRYYSNTLGRFMMPDPYEAGDDVSGGTGSGDPRAPQTWNRYAYVLGDPVNFLDPSGLESITAATGCQSAAQMVNAVGGSSFDLNCPTFSVTVTGSAADPVTAPSVDPMYTTPDIWSIGDSLAQPMPTYTGPIPTAPPTKSGSSKLTFNQCMAAHASDASLVGGFDLLFGTSVRNTFWGGLFGGNSIAGLLFGSFVDAQETAIDNTPAIVSRAAGHVTTYGRRTSTITSLNLAGKGGLPTALGRSGAAFRGTVGAAGDVLGLGLSFQTRLGIDIGLTAAEAAYCAAQP